VRGKTEASTVRGEEEGGGACSSRTSTREFGKKRMAGEKSTFRGKKMGALIFIRSKEASCFSLGNVHVFLGLRERAKGVHFSVKKYFRRRR